MLLAASRHRKEKVSLSMKGVASAGARTRLLHDGPKLCTSVHAHRHLFKLALISELLQRKSIAVRVFPLRFNILRALTFNNQPILNHKARVNNSPKRSKPRRGFMPLPSLDFHPVV